MRHAGDDRRGRHSRHRACAGGGSARPPGHPARTRGRGPRRDGAQLRSGLGVRPRAATNSTRPCARASCGSRSARRFPASASGPPDRSRCCARRAKSPSPRRWSARADAEARGFALLEPDRRARAQPRAAGQVPGRPALFARRRRRVTAGAARHPRTPGGHRPIHLPCPAPRPGPSTAPPSRDDHGRRHDGDLVLLCPGAAHGGLVREIAGDLPVRRVRLQMMQTEPLGEPLTTAIADGDSFRYYPGFAGDRARRAAATTNPRTPSPPSTGCSCCACSDCTAA